MFNVKIKIQGYPGYKRLSVASEYACIETNSSELIKKMFCVPVRPVPCHEIKASHLLHMWSISSALPFIL